MAIGETEAASSRVNRLRIILSFCVVVVVMTFSYTLSSDNSDWNIDLPIPIGPGNQREEIVQVPTCNFTAFQQQLSLDSWTPVVPFHLLATCKHVFYNRHPKTGSRTLIELMRNLGRLHKYQVITNMPRKLPVWNFTPRCLQPSLERMQKTNYRFAFIIHMFYYDFRRYMNLKDTTIYLNVIREPVPWFISWFNWAKYVEYLQRGNLTRFPNINKITLDRCIHNESCAQHQMGNAIHYLCGHEKVCDTHTEAALQQATGRLHRDYLSVGPMERTEEVLELWEYLLPQMFSGAVQEFRKRGKLLKKSTGQKKREFPNNQTKHLLRKHLELDYKLYDRITDRFQRMLEVVRLLKGIHPEGYHQAWANHYRTVIKRYFFPPS